jgi:hypothetical protein
MSVIDFQRQTFSDTTLDKDYTLKISSRNKERDLCTYCYQYPFDFTVKFNMDIAYNNNIPVYDKTTGILVNKDANYFTYRPEAVIYSKFVNIRKLELLDIVIPRFIPSTYIGKIWEGIKLIQNPSILFEYYVSCYPGTTLTIETDMITIKNNKGIIKLVPRASQDSWYSSGNIKFCDHILINGDVYPINTINGNIISISNITGNILPSTTKLNCANQYGSLFYSTNNPTDITFVDINTMTINNIPSAMLNNIFENNYFYITDWASGTSSTYVSYFKISSYSVDSANTATFKGNFYSISVYPPTNPINIYLFGLGQRDLLEERIFYISIDPFIPVKSTGTSQQLDKMFGALFPYTQSKDWIFLRGTSSEAFLPTDLRNLDKMHVVIYDADVNNLNDVFVNKKQLLCPSYYDGMFTTIICKISVQTKTLKY